MKKIGMAILLGLGLTFTANAANTISLVGDGNDYDEREPAAASFRSINVGKGFDEGDSVYGTEGYFIFGTNGPANVGNQPFTRHTKHLPTWVTGYAQGSNFTYVAEYSTYSAIDNPTLTPGVAVADWARSGMAYAVGTAGNWYEIMRFTIDGSAPSKFRLGIMAGHENTATGVFDPTGLRLSVDGGTAVAVTNLAILSSVQIGMIFFDVTTDGGGGTFSVEGQQRTTGGGPSIAGLTFDLIAANNIVITTVGDGSGYDDAHRPEFRSTNVAKPLDVDHDNVYGTDGLFFAGYGSGSRVNQLFTNSTQVGASWAFFASGANFLNIAQGYYTSIDDPTLTPGADLADWVLKSGVFVSTLTLTDGQWLEIVKMTVAGANTPKRFRLGIMAGNADTAQFQPKAIRVSVLGGTASNTVSNLELTIKQAGWVFFDVDLMGRAGGTFLISGSKNGIVNGGPTIGGITLDEAPPRGTVISIR